MKQNRAPKKTPRGCADALAPDRNFRLILSATRVIARKRTFGRKTLRPTEFYRDLGNANIILHIVRDECRPSASFIAFETNCSCNRVKSVLPILGPLGTYCDSLDYYKFYVLHLPRPGGKIEDLRSIPTLNMASFK